MPGLLIAVKASAPLTTARPIGGKQCVGESSQHSLTATCYEYMYAADMKRKLTVISDSSQAIYMILECFFNVYKQLCICVSMPTRMNTATAGSGAIFTSIF